MKKSFLQLKEAAGSGLWCKLQLLQGPGSSQESWWGMLGVALEAGSSFRGGYWGKFPLTHRSLNPRNEHIPWAGRERIPRSCRGWGSRGYPQELSGCPCTSRAHPWSVNPACRPGFVGFQTPAWKSSSGNGPTSCLPGVLGFRAGFEPQAVLGPLRAGPGEQLSRICCSTVHGQALEQNWKDAPWEQTVHSFCPLAGKNFFLVLWRRPGSGFSWRAFCNELFGQPQFSLSSSLWVMGMGRKRLGQVLFRNGGLILTIHILN